MKSWATFLVATAAIGAANTVCGDPSHDAPAAGTPVHGLTLFLTEHKAGGRAVAYEATDDKGVATFSASAGRWDISISPATDGPWIGRHEPIPKLTLTVGPGLRLSSWRQEHSNWGVPTTMECKTMTVMKADVAVSPSPIPDVMCVTVDVPNGTAQFSAVVSQN